MEYEVGGAMGMQPRDAAGSFGYGATLGLTYQAPENITLAVAYETKSDFQDFEWDIPAHTFMGFPIPGGTEKLAFDQPDALTVGAAFRPMTPLLVAVDVQWIRWSRTNGESQPAFTTDPNLTGAMPWNLDWSDQMVLKIGAQYDVTKQLQVRAGYNYGENPLDPNRAFENIAFPALAEHHFTLGGGYTFGAFTVAAAFMYSPEASIGGSNFDQGIVGYETRMSQMSFDLGATWKF
jgi:long-chain fatty acid transport protein